MVQLFLCGTLGVVLGDVVSWEGGTLGGDGTSESGGPTMIEGGGSRSRDGGPLSEGADGAPRSSTLGGDDPIVPRTEMVANPGEDGTPPAPVTRR